MKYWFCEFLDELTENITKMWVEHKKKKNSEYQETDNLKRKIRFIIQTVLIIALTFAIITFTVQACLSF